jgi:cysteine desulfurase NifS
LIFNSGSRVTTDFRSQHHGIPGLLKERPEPTVTINTLDAKERKINNGDLVSVKTLRGEVSMRALVTDDIVKGAVDANMGGGGPIGPEEWQNCNINELTDLHRYDPISGFPVYKTLLCEIVKVSHAKKNVNVNSGEYTKAEDIGLTEKKLINTRRIYLDYNASTPLDPEVREVMIKFMENNLGNPSSIYYEGKEALFAVETARRSIAQLINCTAKRIIFSGGGSEANNLAIKGIAFKNKNSKNHIITTTIEHPSVLNTCKWLEEYGFKVTYLKVDNSGIVNPDDLYSEISDKTCLVSIMMANNETGSIQPIKELCQITKEHNIIFHSDTVQAIGKIPVDADYLDIDLLTISGHKLSGPKGTGALYIRKGVSIEPLIKGGKQEGGLRAGTENVYGIAGFGKAAELAVKRLSKTGNIIKIRNKLENGIKKLIPNARLNGHYKKRLPNTLNITLPEMRGESVVLALDQKGVSLSSGSACRAGSPKPSHALLAMGLSEEEAHCALRFSLGFSNTEEEIDHTLSLLDSVIKDSINIVRFVPCR